MPAAASALVAPVFGASLPVGLAARFSFIIDGLCGTLADHMSRERATIPLLHIVWTMLRRRAVRFARLVARVEAGASAPPRIPVATAPAPSAARKVQARVRLPRGEAWRLVRMIHGTAIYDTLLRHLLEEPEMAKLLARAPQAGRLLRPVLQMLSPHPLPPLLDPPPPRCRALTASRVLLPAGQHLGRQTPSCMTHAAWRDTRSRFGPLIWA